ncbi:MFS superfamily sulfate permease-like transporter [Paraburkholderia youngii]
MGLYGAFFICTITAVFGGRPGMFSGAAGSMAVVIVALVGERGAFTSCSIPRATRRA